MDLTNFFNNGNGNGDNNEEIPFRGGEYNCVICGRKSRYHCRIRTDGVMAICKYVASDKTTSDGRYIHILKTGLIEQSQKVLASLDQNVKATPKADPDKLNEVYTAFLESLELKEQHGEDLVKYRGLSQETVAAKLYKSVPSYDQRFEVAEKLGESFDLEGIPGFYVDVDNGRWALNLTFDGFYVPYRDENGRIVGMQIRQDKAVEPKYLWLSSGKKEKGTSSGVPLHIVNSNTIEGNRSLFITEGALKADVIAELFGYVGLVAMGGVNVINPENLIAFLNETFPTLERVNLAFDMDWKRKQEVRQSILKLLDSLEKTSLKVYGVTWFEEDYILYENAKGLDDLCYKLTLEEMSPRKNVEYVPASEFKEMLLACENRSSETSEYKETENTAEVEEIQLEEAEMDYDVTAESEYTEILEAYPFEDFEDEEEFSVKAAEEIPPSNEESFIEEPQLEVDTLEDDESKESFDEIIKTFGATWGEFSKIEFPTPERVIFGLNRGNVGLLNASTNVGKSTLILNVALSAASNRNFEPFVTDETVGRRILYIDGEATQAELQADINKMAEKLSPEERKLLENNLCLICDEEIDGEPLDLVKENHRNKVLEVAEKFQPDLIVVDTLSALALLEDENDNAKVTKEIIRPLKSLAKKTNAAVLILHHVGKSSENPKYKVNDAQKGRGASALGCLARSTFYLKEIKGNKVELSCPKVKGITFDRVILELNSETRWFSKADNTVAAEVEKQTKYEQVLEVVGEFPERKAKRKNILEAMKRKEYAIGDTTLTRKITEALANGDLIKREYGYYAIPEKKEPETDLGLEE